MLFLRVTLAVLATAGLVSCSSTHHVRPPAPTLTGTASTSTPATPTPSPSRTGPLPTGPGVRPSEKPPQLGPLEAPHNVAGALSFAIFYYRAYDWSVATNDPYLLRQVSLSTCTACQGIISRLDDLAAKKEVVRGGRITLDSADVVSGHFRYRSDYVVEIKIKQDAATIQESGQTPRQVAAATTDDALVFVSWIGDGWRIVEVAKPS